MMTKTPMHSFAHIPRITYMTPLPTPMYGGSYYIIVVHKTTLNSQDWNRWV